MICQLICIRKSECTTRKKESSQLVLTTLPDKTDFILWLGIHTELNFSKKNIVHIRFFNYVLIISIIRFLKEKSDLYNCMPVIFLNSIISP